jgi:phage-related protein
MEWTVVYLNEAVQAEVEGLSPDLRAKFRRIVELIRSKGLDRVREPYVKHLEDRLWEMRLAGQNTIARAIYVAASGRRVVVLHAFIKKTEKTPRRALEIARARAKEVK